MQYLFPINYICNKRRMLSICRALCIRRTRTDADGRGHFIFILKKLFFFGCIHISTGPIGGDESGVAISQIPDFLGLYSLIPDFLGLYSLIPDFWGLYSLIPDFRPLCPVPTFSRPIIMFYIFHMIEKIYINAYPPPLPY